MVRNGRIHQLLSRSGVASPLPQHPMLAPARELYPPVALHAHVSIFTCGQCRYHDDCGRGFHPPRKIFRSTRSSHFTVPHVSRQNFARVKMAQLTHPPAQDLQAESQRILATAINTSSHNTSRLCASPSPAASAFSFKSADAGSNRRPPPIAGGEGGQLAPARGVK